MLQGTVMPGFWLSSVSDASHLVWSWVIDSCRLLLYYPLFQVWRSCCLRALGSMKNHWLLSLPMLKLWGTEGWNEWRGCIWHVPHGHFYFNAAEGSLPRNLTHFSTLFNFLWFPSIYAFTAQKLQTKLGILLGHPIPIIVMKSCSVALIRRRGWVLRNILGEKKTLINVSKYYSASIL